MVRADGRADSVIKRMLALENLTMPLLPWTDEDVPAVDTLKDGITSEVLASFPITDDEGEWESPEEAIGWRMKWFGSNFPPVNVDFSSCKAVEDMVSQMAFAGICCLHTRTVKSFPRDSLISKNKRDGAVYVNDNTYLGSFRVRRGYQRYGAAAYFDSECNLLGIYTCCDGTYQSKPASGGGDKDNLEKDYYSKWRHAMWVWRVSAMALVTVADHLANVHMMQANALVFSTRDNLPIRHPLRAFLKIFTYRTVGINFKAYRTLMLRKGVVNRNWAFEDDDLQELVFTVPSNFKKKFPNNIPESMRTVPGSLYPMNEDVPKFWEIVRELVHDFLCVIYDAPEKVQETTKEEDGREHRRMQRNMDNDQGLQGFLQGLASGLGMLQSRDLSSFDDVV